MADDNEVENEEVVEDRGDEVAVEEPEKEDATPDSEAEAAGAEKIEAKAKGEEEAQEEGEDPTSGQMMPFSRFRAQNLKLREAEAEAKRLSEELAALKAQPVPAPAKEEVAKPDRDFVAEIEAAETKLAAAMEDNDTKAILAANREIRSVERAQDKADYDARLEAVQNETKQTQDTLAARAFEATLDALEREFPQIDPTSDQFDQMRTSLVQDLVRSYESQGMDSEDALLRATAMAFPDSAMAQDLLGTGAAKPAAEKPAAAAAKGRTGIDAKLAAAKSTPPDINDATGENSDQAGMKTNIDVSKLSAEEFDALPPETLARLRGDVVAA